MVLSSSNGLIKGSVVVKILALIKTILYFYKIEVQVPQSSGKSSDVSDGTSSTIEYTVTDPRGVECPPNFRKSSREWEDGDDLAF